MAKKSLLQPGDWVIFRESLKRIFSGKNYQFAWRIGRVTALESEGFVDVALCAPEAPREMRKPDPEKEPWNSSWLALGEIPPEYLIFVHLRNRKSISWVTEPQSRRLKIVDVISANNIAEAENDIALRRGYA